MVTLKVGQVVRVNPHFMLGDLRGGAVNSVMHKHYHPGYTQAEITAIFTDGGVEVKVAGGYDIVMPRTIEPLEVER